MIFPILLQMRNNDISDLILLPYSIVFIQRKHFFFQSIRTLIFSSLGKGFKSKNKKDRKRDIGKEQNRQNNRTTEYIRNT